MLTIRKTIHEATKIYDTGARPILVTCDDLNDWVCKHDQPSNLVSEILGSRFAEKWNLHTPEICLIKIPDEHVPMQLGLNLQLRNFRKLCFGSLHLSNSIHLDNTSILMFKDRTFKKKTLKEEFLKIALFDIWLSNEDRNYNNSNLMIDFSNTENHRFCVFDHGAIFNSGRLGNGLVQITEEDSIINTDLTQILFKKGTKLNNLVNKIMESFYLCVSECEKDLTEIISLIPTEWDIDIELLEKNIKKELFNEKWLEDCEISFRSFIQKKYNTK